MKLTYAVVFEQTPNNYSAYAPDVPGCVSTAPTLDGMREMIREALTYHIDLMTEGGDPIPPPRMSIQDAIAHHTEALAEYRRQEPDEADALMLSTTFELAEVEVRAPQPVAG